MSHSSVLYSWRVFDFRREKHSLGMLFEIDTHPDMLSQPSGYQKHDCPFGDLFGRAFRLAPDILKWMDLNGERSHELAMQDKALEFEKLLGRSEWV